VSDTQGSIDDVAGSICSPEDRVEAVRNFCELIAILREWDNSERVGRAKRILESASFGE